MLSHRFFVLAGGVHYDAHPLDMLKGIVAGHLEVVKVVINVVNLAIEPVKIGMELVELASVEVVRLVLVDLDIETVDLFVEGMGLAAEPGI